MTAPARVSSSDHRRMRWAGPVVYALAGRLGCSSIAVEPTSSTAAPATASRRAGPASATGANSMPRPPPLAAADPVKTNGSSRRASFQAGVAVWDSRTAVYEATPGAVAAAQSPAGRASTCSRRPGTVPRQRSGSSSGAAASALPGPYAVRIQVPMLIGEVGLATRSMWWKRSGRPRSATSRYMLTPRAPTLPRRPARRSAGRPVRSAPAASSDDPAARPPVKKYAGICHSHTGGFSTGRP